MAPEGHGRARSSSRRGLLGDTLWAGLAAALARAHGFVEGSGWLGTAHAASDDMTRDTFNGLLAFVVPGSDAYSASQGVSTAEPGGVDAGATDVLIATVDESTPFVPGFSAQVAAILNNLAQQVNPNPAGHFASPFA